MDPRTGRYTEVRYMEIPLTTLVSNGKQNSVNLLLAAGTDVNFADSLGMTPIMQAVINNEYSIQAMFIYNGVDVNCIDNFYATTLVKAVVRSRFEAAVQLLQNGAKPNVLFWGNKTVLHKAEDSQHVSLREVLVIHGAEVMAEHLIKAAHNGNHHLLT